MTCASILPSSLRCPLLPFLLHLFSTFSTFYSFLQCLLLPSASAPHPSTPANHSPCSCCFFSHSQKCELNFVSVPHICMSQMCLCQIRPRQILRLRLYTVWFCEINPFQHHLDFYHIFSTQTQADGITSKDEFFENSLSNCKTHTI